MRTSTETFIGKSRQSNEKGMALVTTLLFLVVLGLLAATTVSSTLFDTGMAGRFKADRQALYNAEAGARFALGQLRSRIFSGAYIINDVSTSQHFTLPAPTNYPLSANGVAPFSTYTSVNLTKVSGKKFMFSVAGRHGASIRIVDVEIKNSAFMKYGLFANGKLELKNGTDIYSYNSATDPNPTFPLSPLPPYITADATVGSNTSVEFGNGSKLHGKIEFGTIVDPITGIANNADDLGGGIVTGTKTWIGPIDPDPLKVVDLMIEAAANNNNAGVISGTTLSAVSVTLPPGKYYLTSLSVDFLYVTGPVELYINGPMTVKSAQLNETGKPTDLLIYTTATSIDFDNAASVSAGIYAPKADIFFKNNCEVKGGVFGKQVELWNNMDFLFDKALQNKMHGADLPVLSIRYR